MTTLSVFRRMLCGFGLALAALALAPAAHAQGAARFSVIDPPKPTEAGGRIEVLEFFQYGCPHCRAMEPLVEAWAKKQSDDVVLRKVPVAFNAAMQPWQRLYYTLETMERPELGIKVFAAIQTERNPLNTRDRVVDWAVKQGLDKAQFESVYDSFGVQTKVQRAAQLASLYAIEAVPTLTVAGRYMTSPAQANGYPQSLEVVDQLIAKVRQGGKG